MKFLDIITKPITTSVLWGAIGITFLLKWLFDFSDLTIGIVYLISSHIYLIFEIWVKWKRGIK